MGNELTEILEYMSRRKRLMFDDNGFLYRVSTFLFLNIEIEESSIRQSTLNNVTFILFDLIYLICWSHIWSFVHHTYVDHILTRSMATSYGRAAAGRNDQQNYSVLQREIAKVNWPRETEALVLWAATTWFRSSFIGWSTLW